MAAIDNKEPMKLESCNSNQEGITETVDLQELKLERKFKKNLSLFSIICVGWNICASWAALAASFVFAIGAGTTTVVYGLILVVVVEALIASALAELASVYPTAGGQYHWTSILAPKKLSRSLSYWCGAANVFSWITITAGITFTGANFILALAIKYHENFVPKSWHYFIVFQSINLFVLLYSVFGNRLTSWLHHFGFALTLSMFLTILVTSVARTPSYQSSKFVWTTYINNSGWSSDAIVFLTGLITPNYIYVGLDGAMHLAEDCTNPAIAVPRALMSTVVIGAITAFSFLIAMLYSVVDLEAAVTSPTGVPIFEIWIQSSRSLDAATAFMVAFIVGAFISAQGCQQTASRLLWSFARDDALLFSRHLVKVPQSLNIPVWSMVANAVCVFILGCIFLGSTTAFNAIIGSSLILQHITFAIPSLLLMYRRRSSFYLKPKRSFRLGHLGWVANFVTVAFTIIITIFYSFPPVLPVTGINMNYTAPVLAGMASLIFANWLLYASDHYRGPCLE